MPDKTGHPENDKKMPFTKHLEELRWRVIISVLAVAVGFIFTYSISESIVILLQKPYTKDLVFLGPTEAFFINLKTALFAAVFVAMPVILFELWKFVAPGLYEHEKRLTLPFVFFSTLFFVLGGFFAYTILLPRAVRFFLKFGSDLMEPMITIDSYFSFTIKLILGLGVIFQFPLVIVFFNKIGILQVRTLAKNRKYAILIIFFLAAILTPPDVFSQLVMAAPLIGLYELSILAIRIFGKKSDIKKETT